MPLESERHAVYVSGDVKLLLLEYKRLTGISMLDIASEILRRDLALRVDRRRSDQTDVEDWIHEKEAKDNPRGCGD